MKGDGVCDLVHRLLADRRGAIATFVAIAAPVLVGFAGLGIDVANWYDQRRVTQNAADAAAVAATFAYLRGDATAGVEAAALREAMRNGYGGGAEGLTVTVLAADFQTAANGRRFPTTGSAAVARVVARETAPVYFAGLFVDPPEIGAAATGGTRITGGGTQCILALNETAAGAINLNGTADADIGCGVQSNSNASTAIRLVGNAMLRANPARAVGDISIGSNASIVSDFPLRPFSNPVPDPLADAIIPAPAAADLTARELEAAASHGQVIGPGRVDVRGNVTINSGDTLTLAPGTTLVVDGRFRVNGGAALVAPASTLVVDGEIRINGGGTIALSPPAEGALAGIVLAETRATAGQRHTVNGGAAGSIQGIVYAPGSEVRFTGGATIGDSCTQIIADTVSFEGNSFLSNTEARCEELGVTSATGANLQVQVVLLE